MSDYKCFKKRFLLLLVVSAVFLFFSCQKRIEEEGPKKPDSGRGGSIAGPGVIASDFVPSDLPDPGERDMEEIRRQIQEVSQKIEKDPQPRYFIQRSQLYLDMALDLNIGGDPEQVKEAYMKAVEDFNRSGAHWDQIEKKGWEFNILEQNRLIKPGYSVADVGVGPGYCLYYLAHKAGDRGKVYAVDIDPFCFDFLKNVNKSREYENIVYVHNRPDDLMLDRDSIDLAFMRASLDETLGYRNFADEKHRKRAVSFIASIHRALKDEGRIFIYEYLESDNPGDENRVFYNVGRTIEEIEKTGYFKIENKYIMGDQFVLIFRKAPI